MDQYCKNCHQQNAPDALICGQCASPLPLNQPRGQVIFKCHRATIVAAAMSGIFLSLPVATIPLLILWDIKRCGQEGLMIRLLWLVISMLPVMLVWYFYSNQIKRLLKMHIVLDDLGLRLNIPIWAYSYWQAGQEVHLGWNEVERITYDFCYRLMRGIRLYGYIIYTSRGTYKLTSLSCSQPETIATMIAARAGKSVEYVTPKPEIVSDRQVLAKLKWYLLFVVIFWGLCIWHTWF